jgi:hypothetical protein
MFANRSMSASILWSTTAASDISTNQRKVQNMFSDNRFENAAFIAVYVLISVFLILTW